MLVAAQRALVHTRPFLARARFYSSPSVTNISLKRSTDLKPLLSHFKTFLKKPDSHLETQTYVNSFLDKNIKSVPNAADLYEKIIAVLLGRHFYKEAIDVYQRMLDEEIIPTLESRAQISALAFSFAESDEEIDKAVEAIFIQDDLTQSHIARVLEHALHFEGSSKRIARIQEVLVARKDGYAPPQGLVSKLVDAQVREGDLDAAFATILQHGDSETPGPYAAMINALRDTNPADTQALNLILGFMYEQGIKVDLAVMNSLLSWELHNQSLSKLWKIYHIMKLESETNAIVPNATTFGILFSSFLQEGAKNMAISPRSVYHDMILFHRRVPMKINTHLMNIALRVFIESRDYAGAYIILRSFRVYGVRVTAGTYSIALQHIAHRIAVAIEDRVATKYRWPCAFLRVSAQELKTFNVGGGELVGTLLALSKVPALEATRDAVEKYPRSIDKYITPSLEQIKAGITSLSFSVLPLERILLRAILAGAPDLGELRPSSYVGERIRNAKEDMLIMRDN